MNANDWFASGRLRAVDPRAPNSMPYFRTAVFAMIPRPAPGLGTFCVTRTGVMLWDPDLSRQWTVEECAGVIVHEAMHLMRDHAGRRERMGADPSGFNCAGDLEINDDLQAAGLELPGDGLFPDKLGLEEGLTAEEYYHLVMRKAAQAGAGGGKGGDRNGEGGDGGRVAEALGIVDPTVGSGRCGGCAGNPLDEEADVPDGTPQRSEAELQRVRRQTAEAVRQEAARGRGTVPGGLERWAGEYLSPPRVSWRQQLQRACRGAIAYRPGAVDLRYNWPSRRQGGIGYGVGKPVLPALRAPVPRVSVAVDTSGSMGEDELREAVGECNGILKAVGAQIDFIACDARVNAEGKVGVWQQLVSLLKGGGGTDFRPIFEALSRKRPRPDVVVVCTDGMGPAPAEPPPYRVIWLLVGPCRRSPCDWGEQIELEREEGAP